MLGGSSVAVVLLHLVLVEADQVQCEQLGGWVISSLRVAALDPDGPAIKFYPQILDLLLIIRHLDFTVVIFQASIRAVFVQNYHW